MVIMIVKTMILISIFSLYKYKCNYKYKYRSIKT